MSGVKLALLVLVLAMAAPPSIAAAGDGGHAHSGSSQGTFWAGAELGDSPDAPQDPVTAVSRPDNSQASSPAEGTWELKPVCESLNGGGCVTQHVCDDGSLASTWYFTHLDGTPGGSYTQCPGDPAPTTVPQVEPLTLTPAQVLRAFERVPLPESVVMIPPHGETLVGFPTNVYTEARAFTEQVEFFGGRVMIELDIRPSSFLWHRGDGTSQTTDWPGRAWQQSDGEAQVGLITHAYDAKATDAPVSVDTTWSAAWSLNGKDMGEVPGTVTIEGEVKPLDVLEARPVLVG